MPASWPSRPEPFPRLYAILQAWKVLTGCSVLVNTSFNVRGEPIVATPADAFRCFAHSGLDALVIERCVLLKSEQPTSSIVARPFERD